MKRRNPLPGIILGIVLIAHVFITTGFSAAATPQIHTPTEAEEFFAGSDSLKRPFAEFMFEETFFAGLYLYENDEDVPTDWVMGGWLPEDGSYYGGKYILFFIKAEGTEPPEDEYDTSYILRYPSEENSEHIDWAADSIVSDLTEDGTMTRADALDYVSRGVLQADRNGITIALIEGGVGIIAILISLFMLIRKPKVPSMTIDTHTDHPEADREFNPSPDYQDYVRDVDSEFQRHSGEKFTSGSSDSFDSQPKSDNKGPEL